jgi:hypothetical protein
VEPAVLAEQLLAPLSPELYDRERRVRGRTPAEIVEALALLAGVLRPAAR